MSGETAELLAYSASPVAIHPSAGRYTMALAQEESAAGGGYGFETIQVSKRGMARFAGTLPGGARFAVGVRLDSGVGSDLSVSTRQTADHQRAWSLS